MIKVIPKFKFNYNKKSTELHCFEIKQKLLLTKTYQTNRSDEMIVKQKKTIKFHMFTNDHQHN